MHSGTHVHPFYTEDGRRDQLRFFDYWLKGIDNGVMDEPPVKLFIRNGNGEGEWRNEQEWPLARTQWTKLYLDLSAPAGGDAANTGTLVRANPATSGSRTYFASGSTKGGSASASSHVPGGEQHAGRHGRSRSTTAPLAHDTEITGPVAAQLWVSSSTEDMDLFLTIRNIDPDGNDVWEVGQQGQQVPVAKGWLRVSHRELDPDLSLPYRPYHAHKRRLYLDARRDRAGAGRDLADLDGVPARAIASGSTSSRATGSAASTTRTITPTTTAAPTRSMPAASRSPICCCR